MGSLSEIYFKKETLETLVKVLEKKGENGIVRFGKLKVTDVDVKSINHE